MSEIDQLLSQVPLAQIAQELGVEQSQAEASSRTALEALLGGLQANASDPAGAASLGQALSAHDGSLLGADLGAIDQQDGAAIVDNIFGGNTNDVIARLGGARGAGGSGLIAKLLPILAPFVLAWLGKKLRGRGGMGDILGQVLGGAAGGSGAGSGSGAGGGTQPQDSGSGLPEQPTGPLIPTDGGEMTDVTDAADSRGGRDSRGEAPGGSLGDILGQVLGGAAGGSGSGGQSGPSITDILGGLLGGGKR